MGNKSSSEQNLEDFDPTELDYSQDTSGVLVDGDPNPFETEQYPKRTASMSNKDLASLFETYKDVFLDFSQLELVEKTTDDIQANVYRGYYGNVEKREALIKLPFNTRFTIAMAKKLAKQAGRYVRLRHDNIVHLFGFALSGEQLFVVTEHCPGGCLLTYLHSSYQCLTLRRLGQWALDIAKGMQYLATNNVVHGNLCAAVCQLTDTDSSKAIVKISDFIHPQEVGLAEFSVFPLRWVAPETIDTGGGNTTYSGDVWSFGIVLWELFTGGKQPYPNISSNLVLQEFLLHQGGVHEKPTSMPQEFYDAVMMPCLNHSSGKRPTFAQIIKNLEKEIPSLTDTVPERTYSVSTSTNKKKTNTK